MEYGQEMSIRGSVAEPIEVLTEVPVGALPQEQIEEPVKKRKKIVTAIIIPFCTLLTIYFGMTEYYMDHFYYGSEILSINVSGKTAEEAKKTIASALQNYTLTLKEREGKMEQIKGSDIDLKYHSDDEFNKLIERQNAFKWIFGSFAKESNMTIGLSYDNKLLRKQLDTLSGVNIDRIIEPKNPSFQYQNNHYIIINEVLGNKVNKDILSSRVVNSILSGETILDLESAGCYINPEFLSTSKETREVKDLLNKYVSSKITYTFGKNQVTVDGSIINQWLTVNDQLKITLDEKKVKAYIKGLSKTYDTVGKTRKFVTSSGNTVNIGGGDYGWSINRTKETQNLMKAIEEGRTITKEPEYRQTALGNTHNDIGNTYVEINLSKQHLWFYKNGSLIVQGNIVTGNVARNFSTPRGIYSLKYKQRNAVLKGPGYAAPVRYWMPFNGGIGIHDASWRSSFGGSIYRSNGSHGCVNAPARLAKVIFNNIEEGTPIICYR